MRASALLLLLPVAACCAPLPKIAVSSLSKTLADAARVGKESKASSLDVEATVAYGVSGGITIPVAVPVTLGVKLDASTKLKFSFKDLSQVDPDDALQRLVPSRYLKPEEFQVLDASQREALMRGDVQGVFVFDPNTGKLEALPDEPPSGS